MKCMYTVVVAVAVQYVLAGLDVLCGEVAKEVARVVAREALSFLAIEKATLDRQAEEEAALAWAEKRAADKQAAAAAAAQQRAREAAEQAAIDAAATSRLRTKEQEL